MRFKDRISLSGERLHVCPIEKSLLGVDRCHRFREIAKFRCPNIGGVR